MENRQLESELSEVNSRRKQLHMMNQHLSIPLSHTSSGHGHNAAAVTGGGGASSGPTGGPTVTGMVATANPQSHRAGNAASIVCPGSIAVAATPGNLSGGVSVGGVSVSLHAPHPSNTVNAGTSTNKNVDSISIADTPNPTSSNVAGIDGMHPNVGVTAPSLSQNTAQVLTGVPSRSKMVGAGGGRGSASVSNSSLNPTSSSTDLIIPSNFMVGAKDVNEVS